MLREHGDGVKAIGERSVPNTGIRNRTSDLRGGASDRAMTTRLEWHRWLQRFVESSGITI